MRVMILQLHNNCIIAPYDNAIVIILQGMILKGDDNVGCES